MLTLTARNLDSFERYGMSTFPFLLALASATRHEDVDRTVLVISAAALAGYAILGFLGLSSAARRADPSAVTRGGTSAALRVPVGRNPDLRA